MTPRRRRGLTVALLAALAISIVVHGLVLLPLLARFLARPAEPVERERPVEVTWEPERVQPGAAQPMAAPRKQPPTTRPRRRAAPRQAVRSLPRLPAVPRRRSPRPLRRPPPPRPRRPPPRPQRRPPPPRPRRRAPRPRPVKLQLYHKKMVDQDNPRTEPPPRDARFLAQRNRNVRQETRARHTNLDRHSRKVHLPARPRKRVGWLSRQTRNQARQRHRAVRERAGAPRRRPRPRPRKLLAARPRPQPPARPARPSLLSMRNLRPSQDRALLDPRPERLSHRGTMALRLRRPARTPARRVPSRAVAQRLARPRLKLRLTPEDADRIFGKQWAAEWKARNRRRGARGPKSRRWKRIQAALENYVPEVREGNQTALKTRAHPYAAYIAAMHRKIHPLWGDGFLVDLDRLPSHDKFNDWQRWAKLEIVLDSQGRVVKAGVVKPSGFLPFDVAALDVVFQAAPFGAPPRAILSYDGRVYLHWRFHRDQRQCGTFGVDPFILTGPKGRRDVMGTSAPGRPERAGRMLRRRGSAARPEPRLSQPGLDQRARGPAAAWTVGFAEGKVGRMMGASDLPFFVSGRPVRRASQLEAIYQALVAETPNRRLSRPLELLTAAGLRLRLGGLPRGVRPGTGQLYVVVRYGHDDLTLVLQQRGSRWAVVGLSR